MITVKKMGEAEHGSDFRVLREHGHPAYLLLLVKTPALFETDGEELLTPPDVAVLFRPGQRHCYRAAGERYADAWMHLLSPVPLLFEAFPFATPVPLRQTARFYQLFQMIGDEFYANRRNGAAVVDALTTALLEMIASQVEVTDPLFAPLLALRREIFRSPAKHWNVSDEAGRIGISAGYLHALYQKFFGTTPLRDVIRARVQAAEELLLSTPCSVAEIAERCGYWNTEHFIRQFRALTGTTPLRFRRGGEPS